MQHLGIWRTYSSLCCRIKYLTRYALSQRRISAPQATLLKKESVHIMRLLLWWKFCWKTRVWLALLHFCGVRDQIACKVGGKKHCFCKHHALTVCRFTILVNQVHLVCYTNRLTYYIPYIVLTPTVVWNQISFDKQPTAWNIELNDASIFLICLVLSNETFLYLDHAPGSGVFVSFRFSFCLQVSEGPWQSLQGTVCTVHLAQIQTQYCL